MRTGSFVIKGVPASCHLSVRTLVRASIPFARGRSKRGLGQSLGFGVSSVEPGWPATDGSPSGVGVGAFSRRENAGSVPPTFEGEGLFGVARLNSPAFRGEVRREPEKAAVPILNHPVQCWPRGKRESASYAVVERPRSCPSSNLKSRKRSDERALSRLLLSLRSEQWCVGASVSALRVLPGPAHRSSSLRRR